MQSRWQATRGLGGRPSRLMDGSLFWWWCGLPLGGKTRRLRSGNHKRAASLKKPNTAHHWNVEFKDNGKPTSRRSSQPSKALRNDTCQSCKPSLYICDSHRSKLACNKPLIHSWTKATEIRFHRTTSCTSQTPIIATQNIQTNKHPKVWQHTTQDVDIQTYLASPKTLP